MRSCKLETSDGAVMTKRQERTMVADIPALTWREGKRWLLREARL